MKTIKFTVPIYGWDMRLSQIESKHDVLEYKNVVKKIGINALECDVISHCEDIADGCTGGARCFSNGGLKMTYIVLHS